LFNYRGHSFEYWDHPYNDTRLNERAVEVPIALSVLRGDELDTLEIGAVLPHYLDWDNPQYPRHTVVDLYEQYPGVINADVLQWEPPRLYQRIISISTLEHLDDTLRFYAAVTRLQSWLEIGGTLLITVPHGQIGSLWMDAETVGREMPLVTRLDKAQPHEWHEADLATQALDYGHPLRWANSVYIAEYVR
jgi:hypothetical protein